MALFSLDSLLACLQVREEEPGRWTAPNLELAYHRIFGGQLLAQAVAVATATTPGKVVKSITAAFPREGSTESPFDLLVDPVHDGRTFATRVVTGRQGGKTFFTATVSLHAADDGGLEHDMPAGPLLAPDGTPDDAVAVDLSMVPWETRAVGGVDLADRGAGEPTYAWWTRVADRALPDVPVVHQALLAHATDLSVIGTALRPHDGYSQADSGSTLHTAVTTHAVWFHRPFRIDDWCLVAQHAPVTAAGRAFGLGHTWDAGGRLVASFAQESMIRLAGS